uniref:RRM domain-containing protein n=1 Tax=Macrostomum lignano TaxID=282301 RepID=A0A1I8H7L6_9PLAT
MGKQKKSKSDKDIHSQGQHKKKKKKTKSKKEKRDREKRSDKQKQPHKESLPSDESLNSSEELGFDPVRDWQPMFDSFYDPVMAGNADGGLAAGLHDRAVQRALLAQAYYRPDSQPHQLLPLGVGREEGELEQDCVIFVGRLDAATTEADLCSLFETCGRVANCRLVRDWATGLSRRYGFVQFCRAEDAQRALRRCDGATVLGRQIIVDRERSLSQAGWVPRRLGGGLGGRKESGQLRFGCRARPFRRPVAAAKTKDRTMADLCPGLLWSVLWFFILILLAWPIAFLIAWLYILLLPFSACIQPLQAVCEALLGVVKLCLTCAEGMIAMKPLCG